MKVNVLPTSKDFVLPKKAEGHQMDFCYDVTAVSEEEIAPGIWKYSLGFAAQICREEVDRFKDYILDIDFRPRSSVWKTGMVLSNCEGTIDEIFTGTISAVFYKVIPDGIPYQGGVIERYHKGDRIGQIKIGITVPM